MIREHRREKQYFANGVKIINEKGACFSCMFLPEFVCTHFNQLLDRDVFLGETERFNGVGYWK